MLGNWSFGDYFKREAIHWAWEFLTRRPGHPRRAAGRHDLHRRRRSVGHLARRDRPAAERMARWGDVDHGDDKNFWRMADTGPCGPCSETALRPRRAPLGGSGLRPRPQRDTARAGWRSGTWCSWSSTSSRTGRASRCRSRASTPAWAWSAWRRSSRVSATNYDTDLFTPILARMRELLGHDPDAFESERFSYQVIADHSRAITFLIADGVLPANEGRGYVLRRIVRRAVRHGRLLGRREPFLVETASVVIELMGDAYPILRERRAEILGAILREETAFARTLDAGHHPPEEALIPLTGRRAGHRPAGRTTLPEDAPCCAGGRRLPAPRHLRLPHRPDRRAGRRVRRARRPRRASRRRCDEQRERSRSGRKADLSRRQAELGRCTTASPVAPGDTRLPGLRDHDGRGPGRGHRARRHRVPGAGGPAGGRAAHGGLRRGAGARPDAVLRRGRRPGRRPRRASATPATDELLFTVRGHPAAGGRAHRPPRHAPRPRRGRPGGAGGGGRRPARPHDAQPHRHAPAAPRDAQRASGDPARQAGSLVDARIPALRLPLRPRA